MGKAGLSDPSNWQAAAGSAGLLGVAMLALTVTLVYVDDHFLSLRSAYDSAQVCAAQSDISSCRYQGPARIVRTSTDKGNPAVEVAFDQLGGRIVSSYVDTAYLTQWRAWEVNSVVDAELWNGSLTVVAGVKTNSDPDTFPASTYVPLTFGAGAVTVLLGVFFAWSWTHYRRRVRERAAQQSTEAAEHPLATQQLPLTADMTNYLNREAGLAQKPVLVALAILVPAALVPAILTVVLLLQNTLFQWAPLLIWVGCLGLGGLLTWAILRDLQRERLDLVGGVFVRSTGLFSVKVTYSKAGSSVQVVVGGRTLSGDARPLLSIDSMVGSVDYLPVSGDLLEVRDESGRLLWSRFTPAQSAAR